MFGEWQPIETVEDGDRVLVYIKKLNHVCESIVYKNGSYYDPVYDEWNGEGATHWMPLPTPPSDGGLYVGIPDNR